MKIEFWHWFQGENYHPEKPKDGSLPKYWNNDPKLDEANSKAFLEMAHMKAEVKKHKEKIKQEQVKHFSIYFEEKIFI